MFGMFPGFGRAVKCTRELARMQDQKLSLHFHMRLRWHMLIRCVGYRDRIGDACGRRKLYDDRTSGIGTPVHYVLRTVFTKMVHIIRWRDVCIHVLGVALATAIT